MLIYCRTIIYVYNFWIKNILFGLFLMCSTKAFSQYELTKVIKENTYFYNGVAIENKVYFGSSSGIVEYKDGEIYSINPKIKGPIKIIGGVLQKGDDNRFFEYSDDYKNLIPENIRSSSLTSLTTVKRLYLFSKGSVYLFEKNKAYLYPYPSIRTISKNYIGTYGGIFDSNKKPLSYPDYTDGKIKDFGDLSFICWHGLTVLKNNEILKDYLDPDYSGVQISSQNLGSARDIEKIKDNEYILFTEIGVYVINIEQDTVEKILENGLPSGISFIERNEVKGLLTIFFHNDKLIYKYTTSTKNLEPVFKSDTKIISSIGVSNDDFFLLDQGLKFVEISKNKIKQIKDTINLSNDITTFENQILVTKNSGLDIYNPVSDLYVENIIVDEFNSKANFVDNETLFLGSTSGLYKLNKDNIYELYFNKLNNKEKIQAPEYEYSKLEIILILLLIIFIVYIIVGTIKFYSIKSVVVATPETRNIYPEIETFIEENLSTVSIKMICRKFNLSALELYKLNPKIKPGELIRTKRVNKVRELRKKKISEQVISKRTGFSLSYLKKI